jgi:hypothetical protein
MAKQIKRTDIAEADLYKDIRESATKTIVEINKVNQELQKTAQVIASSLKGELEKTTKSIENFSKNVTTMNGVVEQSLKMDEAKAKALKVQADAEIKLQKLAQEKEKTAQQELKTKQQQEKQANANARAVGQEGDAYKKLVIATRDQKNESKKLGAELLNLEKEGKKNTKAYRDLEKQYREVTKAAQQGDAQLKKLDKTVGDNFRNVGNYQSALSGLNKVLGVLGVGVGINAFKNFISESIELSRVQEKAVAQVQAGLISTNNAVGYSLEQLTAKAAEFQRSSLFGDEQILQDLTSVMLTFTNVTGESFDRAQQAALDLSTRMGGDLKGAAVQLGKALNDPIKGTAALAKSGIQFTEQQKEQIKTLSESGDIVSAQSIILDELNTQFGGSAKAAAEADGGITQLSNAFNDMREVIGKVIIENIKPMIQGLRDFFLELKEDQIRSFLKTLATIGKVVGVIAAAFLSYKITVAATNVITKAYSATLGLLNLAFGKNAIATKGADTAMKAFNATTKANPIGLLVTLLATAVTAFISFADTANSAEKAQKRLNDAIDAGTKTGKRAADLLSQVQSDRIKQLEIEARERIANGEDEKRVNAELLEQKKAYFEAENQFIDASIQKAKDRAQRTIEQEKRLTSDVLRNQELLERAKVIITDRSSLRQSYVIGKYNELYAQLVNERTKAEIDQLNARKKENEEYFKGAIIATKENEKEITEERKAAQQKRQQELDLLRRRAEDLEDARIDDEFKRKEKQLKRAFEREMAAIKGNSEIENRLRKELKLKLDSDLLQLDKERFAKEKKQIEDLQDESIKDEFQRREQQLWRAFERDMEQIKGNSEEEIKLRKELAKKLDEQLLKLEQESNDKKYQEEVKAAEKRTKQKESENLDKISDQNEYDIEEQKRLIEHLKELLAIQRAYGKDVEALDTEIALKKAEKQLETMQKETTTMKDNSEMQKKIIDEVTNYAIKKTDERIAAIDREIAAAQRQADYFAKLAAEGNITAEQSLLEQQRIIDEAEKEREQLERRKQQIQLISAGVSTYQSKVAAGDQSPLLNTIKDITLLTQFLSNLPAFFDGTEDTGAGGGIDGKGGFHAVLHPHERVVPASENAKLKGLSNSELADVGMKYKNGQLVDFRTRLGMQDKTQTNELLLKEIKDLKEVIASQPQTDWNIGEVTQESFNLIKRTVSKNTVIYNKFRLKK